jgi:hypothetical protein
MGQLTEDDVEAPSLANIACVTADRAEVPTQGQGLCAKLEVLKAEKIALTVGRRFVRHSDGLAVRFAPITATEVMVELSPFPAYVVEMRDRDTWVHIDGMHNGGCGKRCATPKYGHRPSRWRPVLLVYERLVLLAGVELTVPHTACLSNPCARSMIAVGAVSAIRHGTPLGAHWCNRTKERGGCSYVAGAGGERRSVAREARGTHRRWRWRRARRRVRRRAQQRVRRRAWRRAREARAAGTAAARVALAAGAAAGAAACTAAGVAGWQHARRAVGGSRAARAAGAARYRVSYLRMHCVCDMNLISCISVNSCACGVWRWWRRVLVKLSTVVT